MKRLLKFQSAALALTLVMGFAVVARSQTNEKVADHENGKSEKVREDRVTESASSAKVKTKADSEKSKTENDKTGSAAKYFKTALGVKQNADAATPAQAQAPAEDPQALAKKLANPISSLISVPFQNNFDFGMGPNKDGFRYTMNFQPVIPVALNKDWNMISRTIVPVMAQHNVVGTSTQFGLGDTLQSFFFSPNKSEPFVWGVGPVLLIPTATDEVLGTQKLGIGPTIVVLKQQKKWTVGMLANHIWSVAGKESRSDVSSTFIQPFVSYTTKTAWTITVNAETTYDWTANAWNVPLHFQVTKLVKFGKQPVSVGGGIRCWATSAPGGPHWCGFRVIFTPLFPKK